MRRLAPSLGLVLALASVGCAADLVMGVSDEQASAIVVALDGAGIAATKEAEVATDPPRFRVRVGADDVADALGVLRSEGLPNDAAPGLAEVFGEGSLVPTPVEEHARLVAALSGELARSIERIDGVLDARVHLALPRPEVRALDAPTPSARASVLVRYRGATRPYDEAALRRLVAGAVEGLAEADVTVVSVAASAPPSAEGRLAHVGPFAVARGSAGALRVALGVLLASNLGVALLLAFVVLRGRARAQDEASDTDPRGRP